MAQVFMFSTSLNISVKNLINVYIWKKISSNYVIDEIWQKKIFIVVLFTVRFI